MNHRLLPTFHNHGSVTVECWSLWSMKSLVPSIAKPWIGTLSYAKHWSILIHIPLHTPNMQVFRLASCGDPYPTHRSTMAIQYLGNLHDLYDCDYFVDGQLITVLFFCSLTSLDTTTSSVQAHAWIAWHYPLEQGCSDSIWLNIMRWPCMVQASALTFLAAKCSRGSVELSQLRCKD